MTETERMMELIERLNLASDAYYGDSPIMTDKEWDALFDELKVLEKETGTVLAGSPTTNVSYTRQSALERVTHDKPMLSADKTKLMDDVLSFAQRCTSENKKLSTSWKEDGLTIVLTYREGLLVQAATRGDGTAGEDITANVRAGVFRNVPMRIGMTEKTVIRGEGTVSYTTFNAINAGLEEPYSVPRSYSGASCRLLDPKEAASRGLEFMAFELVQPKQVTKSDEWEVMESIGFRTAGHRVCGIEDLKAVVASYDPKNIDYPVDGVIIQYDDIAFGESLGATGHHERNKIALKWKDETVETTFRGIDFQPTRTGRISLTAIFDPVVIDGSTVQRATLHNPGRFHELELGVGDRITVYKANLIIPAIEDNLTRSKTFTLPETCPVCGEKVVIRDSNLFCTNEECPAKQVRKFIRFCEKSSMNMNGISEGILEELAEKGLLRNYRDLFFLKDHPEIAGWEGWGELSWRNMVDAIEKSRKEATLSRMLIALGIDTVGVSACRKISMHFHGSPERFLEALEQNFDFSELEDFGSVSNRNIHEYFADCTRYDEFTELIRICEGLQLEYVQEAETPESVFAGKTIVATGTFQHFTRDGINAKIEALGAKAGSSVSSRTDFVIAGEKAGSKLTKAQALGVRVLSEEEFMSMI